MCPLSFLRRWLFELILDIPDHKNFVPFADFPFVSIAQAGMQVGVLIFEFIPRNRDQHKNFVPFCDFPFVSIAQAGMQVSVLILELSHKIRDHHKTLFPFVTFLL